jgi:RNA polymerase sigma-70 factor (ECF subfamily)
LNPTEDKQLVEDVLRGDERAFRAFFDEYYDRLFRFALLRVSGERAAAADIAQATLAKALQRLDSYKGEAQLFTWLCAICRNESTDWLRREGRYHEHIVLVDDYPEVAAMVDAIRMPTDDQPDAQVQRQQRAALIHTALDRLPRNYGDALEWMYIEGLSVREIAQRLAIGREAAQSLLARARRAFAEVYMTLNSFDRAGPIAERIHD